MISSYNSVDQIMRELSFKKSASTLAKTNLKYSKLLLGTKRKPSAFALAELDV